MRFALGVDEVGRGPLAGPVAVGVVMTVEQFDVAREFPGITDSKKLSQAKREKFFTMLETRAVHGDVRFKVEFQDAACIDKNGISLAIAIAVARGVRTLQPDASRAHVYLDGLLKAPLEYTQETITHGDALVPIISLASVAAKVTRDHYMVKLSAQYPLYGLEKHKGYGTREHYKALKKYGLSIIHRRSFIHLDSPTRA